MPVRGMAKSAAGRKFTKLRNAGKPRIEAALFDLGGVVVRCDAERALRRWARSTGRPPEAIRRAFAFDAHHEALERGEITAREYHAHVCRLLGAKLSFEDFRNGWNEFAYVGDIPGVEDILLRLKGRLGPFALSNTNEMHTAHLLCPGGPRIFTHFARVFASWELGARKPEPEAYRRALEQIGADPGHVIFFDDLEANVQAARSLGLHAFRVSETADIVLALKAAGAG